MYDSEDKARAVSKLREVFTDTQQALDMAYSAGILATQTPGYARADSIQYAANLPDGKMKEVLGEARLWLKSTIIAINGLDKIRYKDSEVPELTNNFLQHWFGTNAKQYTKAKNLIKQLKNTLKRSYDLAKTKVANPSRLGARPKEPGYKSNAYPAVSTTLEEEVTPASGRTKKMGTGKQVCSPRKLRLE